MALTRSLTRLDLPTSAHGRRSRRAASSLLALSQRKLERARPAGRVRRPQPALSLRQHARSSTGSASRENEVLGREIVEVVGREVYPALSRLSSTPRSAGERTDLRAPARRAGPTGVLDPRRLLPRSRPARPRPRLPRRRTPTSTTSSAWSSRRAQREHRLRLVTDSVGLPILYFDRAAHGLRFANKPFGDWIGVPADDLLGHAAEAMCCRPTRSPRCRATSSARSPARRSATSAASASVDGELRWVRITLFPDREVGRPRRRRVRGDERHRGRHPHPRRAEGAGSRSCGCSPTTFPARSRTSTAACTYTFVNQAFANWVCKPQDEIYGKTPFEVMTPDVASFLRPILEARAGGRARRVRAHRQHAQTASGAGCTAASRPTSMRRARCAACIAPNTTSTISS